MNNNFFFGQNKNINTIPSITFYVDVVDGDSVELPLDSIGVYKFTVNWGDNNKDTIKKFDDSKKVHTYTTGGIYKIEIYGICSHFMIFDSDKSQTYTISDTLVGNVGGTGKDVVSLTFANCHNIRGCEEGFLSEFEGTSLAYLFYECTSFAIIKVDFLEYTPNVQNIDYLLYGCKKFQGLSGKSLTNIPELISAKESFNNCSSMGVIPSKILQNSQKLQNITKMFINCNRIRKIPYEFLSNHPELTQTTGVFKNCSSLNSISTELFKKSSKITDISELFYGCVNLTTIPENFINSCKILTSTTSMFENCSGLTTVPETFLSNATSLNNVEKMFYNNSNLTSAPYYSNRIPEISNHTKCYGGCVKLSEYEQIPIDWGGLGKKFPLEITIEIKYPTESFYLPFKDGDSYDVNVDWGDGFVSHETSSNVSHRYANKGIYTLKIKNGTIGEISPKYNASKILTVAGSGKGISGNVSLEGSINLTSFDKDFLNEFNSTELTNLFSGCTSLVSIPSGFLNSNTNLTKLKNIFNGCKNLTDIPDGFLTNHEELINVNGLFRNTKILNIPTSCLSKSKKIENIGYLFAQCTSLTNVNKQFLMDLNTITDATAVFVLCSNLIEAPNYSTKAEITNHDYAYYNCTKLSYYETLPTDWKNSPF